MFGTDAIAGWAFHQGGEGYFGVHDWGFWRGVFPGNWDNYGLALSLYLVPGLNLSFIIDAQEGLETRRMISDMQVSADYTISGVGKIMFNWNGAGKIPNDYNGPTDGSKPKEMNEKGDFGNIGASFLLTALDGVQVQVGFSTEVYGSKYDKDKKDANDDYIHPVKIGLGATYSGGPFGVKFRGAYLLGREDGSNKDDSYLTFDIMPYYAITSNITAYLDFGLAVDKKENVVKGKDSITGWWLTPYAKVNVGPGKFQMGVTVLKNQDGLGQGAGKVKDLDYYTIRVPMSLVYSF